MALLHKRSSSETACMMDQGARASEKEALPSELVDRRVSLPSLPSHALLGSQVSRLASKSFWSSQMLQDLERRASCDAAGEVAGRLPPIQAKQTHLQVPSSSEPSSPSPFPAGDTCATQSKRSRSLDVGRPTLTGLYHLEKPSYRHGKVSPTRLSMYSLA